MKITETTNLKINLDKFQTIQYHFLSERNEKPFSEFALFHPILIKIQTNTEHDF